MIPIIRPDLAFDEVAGDLRAVIESGQLTGGRKVLDFEALIAATVGVRHAVATTSATTALHLALAARGIGAGDEVLVSDFSFPASANAIIQTGAVPVFVDCRPGGFDLDVADAAAKVTARTKAIMPVHPFGMPADIGAVAKLAARHAISWSKTPPAPSAPNAAHPAAAVPASAVSVFTAQADHHRRRGGDHRRRRPGRTVTAVAQPWRPRRPQGRAGIRGKRL